MRSLCRGYEIARRRGSAGHTYTHRIARCAPDLYADRTLSASIGTPLVWTSGRSATSGQKPDVPGYVYAADLRLPKSPTEAVWCDGRPHSCCRRGNGHRHTDTCMCRGHFHTQSWPGVEWPWPRSWGSGCRLFSDDSAPLEGVYTFIAGSSPTSGKDCTVSGPLHSRQANWYRSVGCLPAS